METINQRIAICINQSGLTRTAFAERINLSQPYVSQICAGTKAPSDRTIADIAREFNVNETWLRTGEGEMFVPVSRDEQIASFMGELLHEESSFKYRFISMLSRLGENEWAVLEQKAKELVSGHEGDR